MQLILGKFASLIFQSTGYTFNIGGKELPLRGDLVAVLGDTPAIAKTGGFKEGVSLLSRNAATAWPQLTKFNQRYVWSVHACKLRLSIDGIFRFCIICNSICMVSSQNRNSL